MLLSTIYIWSIQPVISLVRVQQVLIDKSLLFHPKQDILFICEIEYFQTNMRYSFRLLFNVVSKYQNQVQFKVGIQKLNQISSADKVPYRPFSFLRTKFLISEINSLQTFFFSWEIVYHFFSLYITCKRKIPSRTGATNLSSFLILNMTYAFTFSYCFTCVQAHILFKMC